jgi:hypothetical protein
MKLIPKIYMFIFIISMILSCKSKFIEPNEPNSKLEYCVVYFDWDSTFAFHLINHEKLIQISEGPIHFQSYYDFSDLWGYNYDFLPKGNYQYSILSFFGEQMTFEFSINSDTLINIPNNFHFKNVDFLSEQELLNRDTIQLLYKSDGCFHRDYEKWILIKENQTYRYRITTDYSENLIQNYCLLPPFVSDEIINDLTDIQLESIKLKKLAELNEYTYLSTETQEFYLKVDNKIFSFSDISIPDWNLFEQLKYKYSINKQYDSLNNLKCL